MCSGYVTGGALFCRINLLSRRRAWRHCGGIHGVVAGRVRLAGAKPRMARWCESRMTCRREGAHRASFLARLCVS